MKAKKTFKVNLGERKKSEIKSKRRKIGPQSKSTCMQNKKKKDHNTSLGERQKKALK